MPERSVYYFARFVPQYRISILERLDRRLGGRLVVCAGQPPGSSSLNYLISERRPTYSERSVRNYWFLGERLHAQPFRDAMRSAGKPGVVLAEESPRSVTLPFLLRHARSLGAGRVLWGHFSSLHRPFDPTRHLQDRYRLAMARSVEACACYTDGIADRLRPYVDASKLFVARNTLDLEPLIAQRARLQEESRESVRRRLDLPLSNPVLAYMGRLVPEKGTSLLLETFELLRAIRPTTLLVIGDGPELETMRKIVYSRSLNDVRFTGFLNQEDAGPYLFAADLMLLPGYLGLVINHAFAYGLPIVSLKTPIGLSGHSPEVEYVRDGENGILCIGQTPVDLRSAAQRVLSDLPRFSRNAFAYARENLGVEQMVDGLYDAIQHAERHYR